MASEKGRARPRLAGVGRAATRDDVNGLLDSTATHMMPSVPVEYRTPPSQLTIAQIAGELLWIGDDAGWSNSIGRWARQRRYALRTELQARGSS